MRSHDVKRFVEDNQLNVSEPVGLTPKMAVVHWVQLP